jgi:hypothetical protein
VVEAEEADQQRAGHAADEVYADHVERVVEAEPELQRDGHRAHHAGDEPDRGPAQR